MNGAPIETGTFETYKWILENITPYDGDESFLAPPTEKTRKLWETCKGLLKKEGENEGVLDIDDVKPSTLLSHELAKIDEEFDDVIVGLQGDGPLQRTMKPLGGYRLVKAALNERGRDMLPEVESVFANWRKTHNDGVFDAYSKDMRTARKAGVITGLPDNYARGRIIGDYRRVALYGVDALIALKLKDKEVLGKRPVFDEDTIRLTEEVSEQIKALSEFKQMGKKYGFDLGRPAACAKEAIQWVYLAYLGAVKQQDGAAMSLGRVDGFFDIFIERDLAAGLITEADAQELIDHFVMKLRLVRHLRPKSYDEIFAGDPTWVTGTIGGLTKEGRNLVTKTSFRLIHTLTNLGPAPEPNLTILWDNKMPQPFKVYCGLMSVRTCSLQYENDSLMMNAKSLGEDVSIACCVSPMRTGQQMQFFGARCNGPKLLLYSLNNGKDEIYGTQVGPQFGLPISGDGPLQLEDVKARLEKYMDWLARLYVNTMNVIHFMHDKYNYETLEMALHDTNVHRFIAFGIAGLSVVADSLAAIEHKKVCPVRDPTTGLTVSFTTEEGGEKTTYGNDDDRADKWAQWVSKRFIEALRETPAYRAAEHTLSILTITSNVMYGKKTGATPDGRPKGGPYAPGANPLHGRDNSGALASLNSVAKIPFENCMDGVSNTFTVTPGTLGKTKEDRAANVAALLDGYFEQGGQHLNVNVLDRQTLLDAMEHPEMYPQLTIRVSGYAVVFNRLSRAQQEEVIARTFHDTN